MASTRSQDHQRTPLPPDADGYCYRDEHHFEETLTRVARDHVSRRASLFEAIVIPVFVLMTALWSLAACVWLGRGLGLLAAGASLLCLLAFMTREMRRVRRIEQEMSCFRCAYPLEGAPVNDAGWGACPECGTRFNHGFYRRPPVEYVRGEESSGERREGNELSG